jgi:hypothetical protein
MTKEELIECVGFNVQVFVNEEAALAELGVTPFGELFLMRPVPLASDVDWIPRIPLRKLTDEEMAGMRLSGPRNILSNITFTKD